MKPRNNRFAKNLRILREARGMNQWELGRAVGFASHLGIVRLEKPHADPKLGTILKLCDALGVDMQTLIFGEPFAAVALPESGEETGE